MHEQSSKVGTMPANFRPPSKSKCLKILRSVFEGQSIRFKRIDDLTLALVEQFPDHEREILRASAKAAPGIPGLPWIVVLAGCRYLGYETEVTNDKDGRPMLVVKEIEATPADSETAAHEPTTEPAPMPEGFVANDDPFDGKGTPHMPAIGGGCHELCGAERPHLGEPVESLCGKMANEIGEACERLAGHEGGCCPDPTNHPDPHANACAACRA